MKVIAKQSKPRVISQQTTRNNVKANQNKKKKITAEERERLNKENEERKLKIQEHRRDVYKDASDPERFYVTNNGLLEELLAWKNKYDPWMAKQPKSVDEYNEWFQKHIDGKVRWDIYKDFPEGVPVTNGIRRYIEWLKQEPSPSEKLGSMFMQIAYRLTNHSFFRNYPHEIKEDCVSYAMEKCVTGIKNYNFKFKNPFAYFTQSCFNSFKTVLSKHYKQINIRRSLTKKIMTDIESGMPSSGIKKCLDNRFANDDYYDYD